jgi:hypothetical protein
MNPGRSANRPIHLLRRDNRPIYTELDRASQIAYVLAGPLTGCSAALLFVVLGVRAHLPVLVLAACVLAAMELCNFWPAERHGVASAGAQLFRAIRTRGHARPTDPIIDVEARWLLLMTDFRRTFGGRDQNLLPGLLAALDRSPTDHGDEAEALISLAFCGWCWREAERGDPTPIRAVVLDARRRAASSGRTGIELTTKVAERLVRLGVDLAAASPIPDSLEKGLPCATNNVVTGTLSQEHVSFAFRYGVALHDVMTIAG